MSLQQLLDAFSVNYVNRNFRALTSVTTSSKPRAALR
jgi:hypothetical protein